MLYNREPGVDVGDTRFNCHCHLLPVYQGTPSLTGARARGSLGQVTRKMALKQMLKFSVDFTPYTMLVSQGWSTRGRALPPRASC